VASANKRTGLPHFESKWAIEQHIHALGISSTILRPVFFMQNWYNYLREPILQGTLPLPLRPTTALQQISVEDIGAFALMAFSSPDRWRSRTVELAADSLTMIQMVELLSRVLTRRVTYVQVPWEQFRLSAGEEMMRMYRWFNDVSYQVDIPTLRREHPSLASLEQVLRHQNWAAAEPLIRKAA
jgi:uncharacterized protein YbjT (DUF2867 family)